MAADGALEGAGVDRDQVSLGVLVTVIGRTVVDRAVVSQGAQARRRDGKLPPHVLAYLVMGMCLFPDDDYEEVAVKVTGTLDEWGCWDADWARPSASGITQARKRLGWKVMREVFESVAAPVAGPAGPMAPTLAEGPMRGAFLRSWRLLAIDGFEVDVPDTPANVEEFGYPSSGAAFPKIRVVTLAECGTHAMVAAEVEGCKISENVLADRLFGRLRPGDLLTGDRNFYSFEAWCQAARTGAELVWRAPTQLRLPVVAGLDDDSYLSVVMKSTVRGSRREQIRQAAHDLTHGQESASRTDRDAHEAFADLLAARGIDPETARLVRVIEYDVPDRDGNGHEELIVVISTILDPAAARPGELARAYHERWEAETGYDQLKTHLRGPGKIFRSRLPNLARQEIWAWLAVHYAISALMTRAAQAAGIDPDRISYTNALRIVRRGAQGSAAFPP